MTLKNVISKNQENYDNREVIKDLSGSIEILNMLQDQKKRYAIQKLVENRTIKIFHKMI